MATYKQSTNFYTPERTNKLNNIHNTFSTTVTKHAYNLESLPQSRPNNHSQQNRRKNYGDLNNSDKLAFFEEKTQELRRYLCENHQISKSSIQHIFGWTDEYSTIEVTKQNILKDLSAKVKALIKQNHELRGNSQTQDISWLKKQNQQLKAVIDQLHRGEATRQMILSEENRYLREYIERHKEDLERQMNLKSLKNSETNQILNIRNENMQSSQNISNLRKYFMDYINTAIEANDHQLHVQKSYIEQLQSKVVKLNKFSNLIEHLQFEKKVKLQESTRKAKNFTIGTPKIIGDRFQYEAQQLEPEHFQQRQQRQTYKKQPYFKSKGLKGESVKQSRSILKSEKSDIVQTGKSNKYLSTLAARTAQLQEQLSILREKYDLEVQKQMRGSSEQQELLTTIQKLNAEKNQLKHQINQLTQQLKQSQYKLSNLTNEIQSQIVNQDNKISNKSKMSIKDQLNLIKQQLQSCEIHKFSQIQKQYIDLVRQRDYLRRQLTQLQSTLTQSNKFSSIHKELFLLREKNSQLEQNCRFYQDQILQYEKQLRLISEQNQHFLAKSISNDFRQMKENSVQGLEWARDTHFCIVKLINRLQSLQNRLEKDKQE